jgi:hypothetical protein
MSQSYYKWDRAREAHAVNRCTDDPEHNNIRWTATRGVSQTLHLDGTIELLTYDVHCHATGHIWI